MRTDELALDYVNRAELTLDEARSAFEKEVYSLTIRRAQETCELSLKGEFMASVSSDLARKRGPAFYGIERSVTPASKIFGRDEGLRALKGAEEIMKLCKRLIKAVPKE